MAAWLKERELSRNEWRKNVGQCVTVLSKKEEEVFVTLTSVYPDLIIIDAISRIASFRPRAIKMIWLMKVNAEQIDT